MEGSSKDRDELLTGVVIRAGVISDIHHRSYCYLFTWLHFKAESYQQNAHGSIAR